MVNRQRHRLKQLRTQQYLNTVSFHHGVLEVQGGGCVPFDLFQAHHIVGYGTACLLDHVGNAEEDGTDVLLLEIKLLQ